VKEEIAVLDPDKFDRRVHMDFETYSELDIRRTGAHKYAKHGSTEVLMLYYAFDDEEPLGWIPEESPVMPQPLVEALRDPRCAKMAFHAAFERLIFKHVLNLDIPIDQWRCTMVASYYLGFVGGLDMVLQQTGLQSRKDPRGPQLINTFSKPAPRNHHAERYTSRNKPREWEEFKRYCHNDVVVERELFHFLSAFPTMPEWDWHRYLVDQEMNDRGAYADVRMAEGAFEIWEEEKKRLALEIQRLSGLERISRGPFLQFLQDRGLPLETTQKAELLSFATDTSVPEDLRRLLFLWMEREGKAASKYAAVARGACDDSRVRGMFQFKGASRTDRTAGRRVQLQNLKRSVASDAQIPYLVGAIESGNAGLLRMVAPEGVSEVLGTSIRHVIQAPEGRSLVAFDLSSIESVVLGWLVYCESILDTFRNGRDTYKVFASQYYGLCYEDITRDQRNFAKPPVLGCGYMLGWKGLISYAEGYGVEMDEESARRAVSTFRTMYPEICEFWTWIYDAVKYVIKTGERLEGYRLTIERCETFLRIWLPSGRALSYQHPEVSSRIAPWTEILDSYGTPVDLHSLRETYQVTDEELVAMGWASSADLIENVSYMGTDLAGRWTRTFAHAGLFTENIVQSIAMDILKDAIVRMHQAGVEVVMEVHDEVVAEVDDSHVEWAKQIMHESLTTLPPWAPDLWLGADGYVSKFYKSD